MESKNGFWDDFLFWLFITFQTPVPPWRNLPMFFLIPFILPGIREHYEKKEWWVEFLSYGTAELSFLLLFLFVLGLFLYSNYVGLNAPFIISLKLLF